MPPLADAGRDDAAAGWAAVRRVAAAAAVLDAAESAVHGWRSLTVHMGPAADLAAVAAVDDLGSAVAAVDDLGPAVAQAAAAAGYTGSYTGDGAMFTVRGRWWCWSWSAHPNRAAILTAARGAADRLNPGTWQVTIT